MPKYPAVFSRVRFLLAPSQRCGRPTPKPSIYAHGVAPIYGTFWRFSRDRGSPCTALIWPTRSRSGTVSSPLHLAIHQSPLTGTRRTFLVRQSSPDKRSGAGRYDDGGCPVVIATRYGTSKTTVVLAQAAPAFLLVDSMHVAGVILTPDGTGSQGGGTYDLLGPKSICTSFSTFSAARLSAG